MAANISWETFRQRSGQAGDFLAIIDANGEWVDSCVAMMSALWAICANEGHHDMSDDVMKMAKFARESGYSIIHSNQLRRMFEAGMFN